MKKLLYTLILFAACIFCFSCKDPTLGPNNYSPFPMDLKVEKLSGNKIKYSWNSIKTSDFIKYVIVRSNKDSVPYFPDPNFALVLPNNISIITAINEPGITEFVDSVNVVVGESFFRIFAFLEDRSLSSINVKLKGLDNMVELLSNADDVLFIEKKNTLVISNSKQNNISFFDINSKTSTTTIINQFSSLASNLELSLIESPMGTEIFAPGQFNAYNIINFNTVFNSLNVFVQRNASSISHANNNWVLSSNASGITSRPRVNFSNFSVNDDINFFFSLSNIPATPFFLKKMNKNKGFYAINTEGGKATIATFYMGDNGRITQSRNFKEFQIKGMSKARPFKFSNDDAQFVMDNNGSVLDTINFTVRKKLAEEVPTSSIIKYADFQFSTLGDEIYALRVASLKPSERLIDVFKFPDCTYVKSLQFYSAPSRFFLFNNTLQLVGSAPNDSRTTIIETVKL